jgi:hypothetical protein
MNAGRRPRPEEAASMASIVVADDDPFLRTVLAEVLADEGHAVRQAVDGAHALALVLGTPPDLVLSDVAMPRLGGIDLAAAVARHAPGVPVVLRRSRRPASPSRSRPTGSWRWSRTCSPPDRAARRGGGTGARARPSAPEMATRTTTLGPSVPSPSHRGWVGISGI